MIGTLARVGIVAAAALVTQAPAYADAGASAAPLGTSVDAGELAIIKRQFLFEDGERIAAEEGLLWVPENRNDPKSRLIPLNFWRVPAADPKRPPIFVIPGGPADVISSGYDGSPGYNNYGALETDWGRRYIELAHPQSDLIIVNQRWQ